MGYLFAAHLILWALTFGYVFSLVSRQRRLERELELLEQKHSEASASRSSSGGNE